LEQMIRRLAKNKNKLIYKINNYGTN